MLESNPYSIDHRAGSGSESKGFRQPLPLGTFLPFDYGENVINPKIRRKKLSKQMSDRYPFTMDADPTEIHITLNQSLTL